jgi:hypothetical protein
MIYDSLTQEHNMVFVLEFDRKDKSHFLFKGGGTKGENPHVFGTICNETILK